MKSVLFFRLSFLGMLGLVFLTQCKEAEIEIPIASVGKRNVLVEELTGVRCPSCPDGTKELVRLDSLYGDNLIIISNHSAGNFSIPLTDPLSAYDFRSQAFKDLKDFIGTSAGYPTASINRILDPVNQSPYRETPSQWGSFIVSELAKDPGMDLFVLNSYDASTRQLTATVRIAPTSTMTNPIHLTVMMTQDSIVDAQIVGTVKKANYVHRYVLRSIFTKFDGDAITESFVPGAIIERTYTFTLPADFVPEHCEVVAAVHHVGTPDKAILQAASAKVLK